MVREINGYYAGALRLAAQLETELPPPLCEACLLAFRDAVTAAVDSDRRHDTAIWQQLRDGRMSADEFLSRVRDRETYRTGAESIRKRRQPGGKGEGEL